MTSGLEKISQPQSVATEVLKTLLDYLFSGIVQPGDRIPSERQLTEQLGVNRPVIRQALQTLSFLGLLDIRQGSGAYFCDPDQDLLFTLFELSLTFSPRRLRELVEARAKLEVLVAGLAAERRSDQEAGELGELLGTMYGASGEKYIEADLAFHAKIAQMACNDVLKDMLKGVRTMVRNWVGSSISRAKSTEVSYQDHRLIYLGIAQGNSKAARAAMEKHMIGATSRLPAEFFDRTDLPLNTPA